MRKDTETQADGIPADRGSWQARWFGTLDWQAPPWTQQLGRHLQRQRRRWLTWAPIALAVLGVAIWWFLRPPPPVPDAVTVTVQAPGAGNYRLIPARIDPLRLSFSAPVAALDVIGSEQERSREPKGLSLTPAHPGVWTWQDDRHLVFTPARDWPLGQDYRIDIEPRVALAHAVVLPVTRHHFDTAAFSASPAGSEFYQDPEDATLKRGVYTLRFSHPVDVASLESRLRMQLADGAQRSLPAPEFSVRYDEHRLTAWVQSQPLTLPDNGGRLHLHLAAGARSELPGPSRAAAATALVELPSLFSVAVTGVQAILVDNERHEPEQLLSLAFNQALRDDQIESAVRAWLLPERRLARADETAPRHGWPVPYSWTVRDIDEVVLDQAEPLPLHMLPAEREWTQATSFRYQAPPGRRIYVRVERGLSSFGGFILGQPDARVVTVPPYPQMLRFVGEGSLLSLRGERRVSLVARNLPHARLEIGRVLPDQLQHLVATGGESFSQPRLWQIPEDALVERDEHRLVFDGDDPVTAQYRGVDLGDYFTTARRGVFLLSLRELSEYDRSRPAEQTLASNAGREHDRRLVVLTDLGVIAKQALDGSREVYVQSLAGGGPVVNARVRVIARNGQTLLAADTDAGGRASLPALDGFGRERQPVMLTVSHGSDLSFLPLNRHERMLDTSRFDVGGEPNDRDPGALRATLFSDRGLYRPGETVHLGMVLRASDWERSPQGLPLELLVTDPRGSVARRERIAFGIDGFEEARFTPPESAPSGPWQAALYLVESEHRRSFIASTTVQVREFRPDTLRVGARLSQSAADGWVHPHGLAAQIRVENLFGTAAQDRKVEGRLNLRPVLPGFTRWPGYRFHDPNRASDGVNETLASARTDSEGRLEIPLGLERYARATYRLDLLVQAFEPGDGRAVSAQTGALVSEAEYLVGVRVPEPLHWINRGDTREVELVAIGPDGSARSVDGLRAVRIERRFVSVLTQSEDGLYRYVSRPRRDLRDEQPLVLGADPMTLALDTSTPGDWTLELRDADDAVLNSIDWTVAGSADLSRSLDRNAELAITLSRRSYAPGEDIEISLRAPYAGRGLITIERERVHAHAWFQADSTASVQRIRVPEGLEGNAYVSVQYLRDPDSDEIFTSPLSWGVAPFEIDRDARTLQVALDVPELAKPGVPVEFVVRTTEPSRVAVFAVDEGILQVAAYRVPDPLDHFLRKRMHQVATAQILDLLLPEFSRLQSLLAAPGGDGEGSAARHLNPFKRRGEAPAVWWSGLLKVDGEHRLEYTMPDHFNGSVRVVAVAVNARRMGIVETSHRVRGDFVLTPTVPTHVAPGDVFELPVGIANTREDGADHVDVVQLDIELSDGLQLDGDQAAALALRGGEEGVARLRLRVGDAPGVAGVTLIARSGTRQAQRRIELSIRPEAVPYASLQVARVERRTQLGPLRDLHAQRAARSLAASASPLVAIDGYGSWLGRFPHQCTEQLVSAAIPALVQARHPEFGSGAVGIDRLLPLFDVLRTRQNAEGGFGYWRAELDAAPFVSVYTALALVEARERALRVPDDMVQAANLYLRALAGDAARSALYDMRARAMAVYLLARQGQQVGDLLATLQTHLERDHPRHWRDDSAGAFVAASYALLQQDRAAVGLATRMRELAMRPLAEQTWSFAHFSDPLIDQAWRVYLLHRHFPDQARRLPASAIEELIAPIQRNQYNTLSLGISILALEAIGSVDAPLPELEAAVAQGEPRMIGEAIGRLRRARPDPGEQALWVTPAAGTPAWYAYSEAGFDRVPPAQVQDRGLEVLRDYLDAEGRPTTTVAVGGELIVRLRLRSRESGNYEHIAVSDLLPGGFELVLTPPAAVDGGAAPSADPDDDGHAAVPQAPALALPGSSFHPDHAEMREDRVVLYGTVVPGIREFRYRIRAGSIGEFAIPPVHAQSMYQLDVIARGGPAGRMIVEAVQ